MIQLALKNVRFFTSLIAISIILILSGGFSQAQEYMIGADLSFLLDAENKGYEFKEEWCRKTRTGDF